MKSLMIATTVFMFGTTVLAEMPDGHVWQVESKACGSTTLPISQSEVYQFKSGIAARIYVSSDSPTSQCKTAVVYQRAMEKFGTSNEIYSEESDLTPAAIREVCRNKVNGTPVDPPTSDQTKAVAGSPIKMTLSSQANTLSVTLSDADECPNGALQMQMNKIQ